MPLPRIDIYDTTLRDGTQGEGFNLSLRDKLLVAQKLDEFGVDYIEGGFPASNPKDAAFFAEASRIGLRRAKLAAFGMTRRRGVKPGEDAGLAALLAARTPVVTIVGKTSKRQAERVLSVTAEENLAMIGESVAFVVRGGRECIYDAEHFFDTFKVDPAYALETLKAAAHGGASVLVLCDTNGGTLPEDVAAAVAAVRAALPSARLGIHTHNDSGLAVACAMAAIRAGCVHAQGTVNGVGERCGNMDLTTLIANLQLKLGAACLHGGPASLARLTELSRYVYDLSNTTPISGQPYVGPSAFAHKGGMHVHAIQKDTATYEHIDPAAVGNVRKILISELSGSSNIAATAGRKYGLEHDKARLRQVLDRVCELENRGWAFEVAEASFDLLVRKLIGRYTPRFDLVHYRVEILKQGDAEAVSEATVKLMVGGVPRHEVAEGDGPIAALDAALRKALLPAFPSLARLHLMDYKVRVVPTYSGDGSVDETKSEAASVVRVVAEFRREHSEGNEVFFGTVGVSANIVDASFQALRDAYDHHLLAESEGEGGGGGDPVSAATLTAARLLPDVPAERLPRHIAIIMDGNGRWAVRQNRDRVHGHRRGADAVVSLVEACVKLRNERGGPDYLTLYSFSVENWKRPPSEVEALMKLYIEFLSRQRPVMMANNVRYNQIGRGDELPDPVIEEMNTTLAATRDNTGLTLTLAINYGSRAEITDAVRAIAQEVQSGRLDPRDVNESVIARHLYTRDMPDVDLLIRTAGEMRVSNYLLWQISYAELVVTQTLWPDFSEADLHAAIRAYASRNRRFGALDSTNTLPPN